MTESALSLGEYDNDRQIGVILFSDLYENKISMHSELMYVDFKNGKKVSISEGTNISGVSSDLNSESILYFDGSSYNLYDLNRRSIVYKYLSANAALFLINDGTLIAGVDYENKKIILIDTATGEEKYHPYAGQFLWGVSWDIVCNCIAFELSKKSNSEHYIINEKDGVFEKSDKMKYIADESPKNITSYFIEGENDDSEVEFIINNGVEQLSYSSTGPLTRDKFLWSNKTLRLLENHALIDLDSLTLLYPTANLWIDSRKDSPLIMDVAYSKSGYVLRWSMEKQLFEVEDIRTGKIIKIHEKFW